MGDKIKMSKEELERQKWNDIFLEDCAVYDKKIAEEYTTLQEQIANLEEKISILLSCKNCPENKGGYICKKEYEGKCLSQKTQYIKELQEENTKLKEEIKKWKDEWQEQIQKENDESYARTLQTIQLTKAIEILKKYHDECPAKYSFEDIDAMAEQFLKENK